MSTVSNKIIQAASGNNGGDITGELIESRHSSVGSLSLTTAPQAGDLLIAHSGGYSGGCTLTTTGSYAFTQVTGINSTPWYIGIYFEGSKMGYRIATGSEGTSINVGSPSVALSVYRFSSPVTSVTSAFTATQEGVANRTITTSSYDKPHIVACTIGSYQDPSLVMTNTDYGSRVGYCDAAASLRNSDSSLTTAVITSNNVSFNEACCYAVLVPNFD